ncbi:hypothetical protein CWE04_05135 [Thomasclavelia cocleata]|uniref:PemK-like, MazF-like toxin of type II toxin-antitoxin system n=1 Tax=Thomasclavelia cocleata TaxID=69824 RepID=A0A1I0CPQ4_9FIRM|nr:hypothetical protein [Thomasclavelia cocleata]MCR1960745.1 hypothetical protein [Thomasclavelia cocleata]NDO42593.1 hypothetical protein [Thomasclavelia cocleata]PJN81150.1 hypothetical protein CWE04_05135 [Thomasclavelia cocleata]SET21485.1 hypothetical protein SAMN04489758_103156 [Thomasclavelia cocleata]
MSVNSNLIEMKESLDQLEKSGLYDVEKFSCSLKHLTSQLEYFYCNLVKDRERDIDNTYYYLSNRPQVHQMAYFNIGRGFPKELMDGHWCYILKDLGYKMLIIPCTSIKETKANPEFEMDIEVLINNKKTKSRLQLSEIRCVDTQRIDLRKTFADVLVERDCITEFIKSKLID